MLGDLEVDDEARADAEVVDREETILIVDDHEANVEYLTAVLRGHGYARIRATTKGRRAVPLFD